MNGSGRRFSLCLMLGLLLTAWTGPSILADTDGRTTPFSFRYGTHAFRRMLADLGMKPLSELQALQDDPAGTLLIVLGQKQVLTELPVSLATFMQGGGAVLVASDQGDDHWEPLWDFGVCVHRWPVVLRGRLDFAYRGLANCPIIQESQQHPIFRGLKAIATNRPQCLARTSSDFQAAHEIPFVAWFPPGARTHPALRGLRLPFAACQAWQQGRILILADHSVFINEMMFQTDNDNLEFAYNCVDWLSESGKRKQVLFIEDGHIQTEFDLPLDEPMLPPLPSLNSFIPVVNKALKGLEDENMFNRLFYGFLERRRRLERLLQVLAVLLTLALVIYGFLRLGQARQRLEPGTPLLTTTLARLAPAGQLVEQRHRALVESGNLWEAARALARQGLENALGSHSAPAQPPPIAVPGTWWQRWLLRQRVRRIWRLAYSDVPVRVSPRQFARLDAQLREIQTALANGRPHPRS